MIDKDAEIRRLNIRVRELEDELAEWKAREARTHRDASTDTEIHLVSSRLGVSWRRAVLLLHMLRPPGVVHSHERLRDIVVLNDDCDGAKLPAVAVFRLRERLTPLGIQIETVWGHGYRIDHANAERLREHLGLVA